MREETKYCCAEMRTLKWTNGYTLQDKIRNTRFGEKIGVVPYVQMMVEYCFGGFGHV
jgi:hypothetical protein